MVTAFNSAPAVTLSLKNGRSGPQLTRRILQSSPSVIFLNYLKFRKDREVIIQSMLMGLIVRQQTQYTAKTAVYKCDVHTERGEVSEGLREE
jgi:hypothetical protein